MKKPALIYFASFLTFFDFAQKTELTLTILKPDYSPATGFVELEYADYTFYQALTIASLMSFSGLLQGANNTPGQDDDNYTINITGQTVNKPGEISQSIIGSKVEFIDEGMINGEAYISNNGFFKLITHVDQPCNIGEIQNELKLAGANPFNNNARLEVSVEEPGRIIAFDTKGSIKEVV